MPAFSVVVPVYNSAHYLGGLIDRLAALEEPAGGYEVVFVDNRSTDGGYELLEAAARRDPRIRVLGGPGIGPAAARNLGIAAATGEVHRLHGPGHAARARLAHRRRGGFRESRRPRPGGRRVARGRRAEADDEAGAQRGRRALHDGEHGLREGPARGDRRLRRALRAAAVPRGLRHRLPRARRRRRDPVRPVGPRAPSRRPGHAAPRAGRPGAAPVDGAGREQAPGALPDAPAPEGPDVSPRRRRAAHRASRRSGRMHASAGSRA